MRVCGLYSSRLLFFGGMCVGFASLSSGVFVGKNIFSPEDAGTVPASSGKIIFLPTKTLELRDANPAHIPPRKRARELYRPHTRTTESPWVINIMTSH